MVGVGKFNMVLGFLKNNVGSIFLALTAFYLGAQNSHIVDKIERSILYRHQSYAENSHAGSLKIEDVENNQGQLEKKVKNMETGDFLYTISADGLPADNDFIYKNLGKRAESCKEDVLKQMYCSARELENIIKEKLYREMPVDEEGINPLKLDLDIIANDKGKLDAVLQYGSKSIILTKKDFEYLVKHGRQPMSETGSNPKQAAKAGDMPSSEKSGSHALWYLGAVGVLAAVGKIYAKFKS